MVPTKSTLSDPASQSEWKNAQQSNRLLKRLICFVGLQSLRFDVLKSTPSLFDFSPASSLRSFEQPAIRVQQLARSFDMSLHAGQNVQMQGVRRFDEHRRTLVYAGAESDERNAAAERFSPVCA
jgi:hypothetical protein